jgi:hypothetical protein
LNGFIGPAINFVFVYSFFEIPFYTGPMKLVTNFHLFRGKHENTSSFHRSRAHVYSLSNESDGTKIKYYKIVYTDRI